MDEKQPKENDTIKKCLCHNKPVHSCQRYKAALGLYLWLRSVEIKSMEMGQLGFCLKKA
jgi:hypothetical protein